MRLRLFLISVALATLLQASGVARADEVDDYVRREIRRRHIPAAAVLVMRDGRVVKQSAYGLANVELSVPASDETLFQIASITKTFTAVGIMSLVEEGKFSLDDGVRKLLPNLPVSWAGVKVRHLLSHTSGLPDVSLGDDTDEVIAETLPEALRKLARMPFKSRPGAKWSYNETGYVLLGMIIEKVSGLSYEEFMARRFFRPLGMTRTLYGDDRAVVQGRASMYTRYERQTDEGPSPEGLWTYRNIYPPYTYMGAGLNTNVSDLSKWDTALSEGRILKPSTLEEMWRPVTLNDGRVFHLEKNLAYANGWLVYELPGHRAVGHSGSDATSYIRFLDDRLTVAVLTNCQGADPDSLALGVASLYIPALGHD